MKILSSWKEPVKKGTKGDVQKVNTDGLLKHLINVPEVVEEGIKEPSLSALRNLARELFLTGSVSTGTSRHPELYAATGTHVLQSG